MARTPKATAPDLSKNQRLTVDSIERLRCPDGKQQAFMRCAEVNGLQVRVTAAGSKSYVYQRKTNGQSLRVTIGAVSAWSIADAQKEARRLAVTLDKGDDPRQIARDKQAAKAAKQAKDRAQALTVGEVWTRYTELRLPVWGVLHYRDHLTKAAPGGLPSKAGLTKPGPLACLMTVRMVDLTQEHIEAWAVMEAKTRPTSARLAWRLLKVFLTWCAEQPEYAALLPAKNPAKTQKAREALGKAGVKADVLQRGQLSVWFAAVRQIQNPTIAACLQIMLLTGARPGEVLGLRWEDVNTQWKGIAIRDKVAGTREIPLTPYVEHLISALPRRNEFVFSSPTSASGYLSEPNHPHTRACQAAGLEGLTLHGLRRSFKSLTEWLEVPVGIVAQIQGHKPSATAEKHYTVRPLELLALHHERIEAWILEQAGVSFDAKAEPGKLRAVA